jgi:hypothetical protein
MEEEHVASLEELKITQRERSPRLSDAQASLEVQEPQVSLEKPKKPRTQKQIETTEKMIEAKRKKMDENKIIKAQQDEIKKEKEEKLKEKVQQKIVEKVINIRKKKIPTKKQLEIMISDDEEEAEPELIITRKKKEPTPTPTPPPPATSNIMFYKSR